MKRFRNGQVHEFAQGRLRAVMPFEVVSEGIVRLGLQGQGVEEVIYFPSPVGIVGTLDISQELAPALGQKLL